MSSVKHILVASDLSPRADKALARAAQLATEHKTTALTALHVLENLPAQEHLAHRIAKGAEENLRQGIEALSLAQGMAVTVRAATGRPFEEIPQWAWEEKADLIVMGAHGKQSLHDTFPSATAEQVVRRGGRS